LIPSPAAVYNKYMSQEPPGTPGLRVQQYQALLDVSESITRYADLAELFRDLAGRLRRIVPFDFITVLLHEDDGDVMRLHVLEPARPSPLDRGEELTPVESPGGIVWQTQQPMVIPDLQKETGYPALQPIWQELGMRSGCYLPLTAAGRRLGTINFASSRVMDHDSAELELLGQVARLVAVAVDNALNFQKIECLRARLAEERDRLRLLLEVNNAVVAHLELRQLFRSTAECLRGVIRQDYTSLALYDPLVGRWLLHALDFPKGKGHLQEEQMVDFEGAPASTAYTTGRPAVFSREALEALSSEISGRLLAEGLQTLCCVPLLSKGRTLGTVNVGRLEGEAFTPAEIELLSQVAGQIALAVENALAYREISELKDKLAEEKLYLEDEIRTEGHFSEIVGTSPAIQKILRQVEVVAPTTSTVLIQGETGTGKELIARALHRLSARRERTFVKLNCAAIPTGLLESELFGHEKGSFTGAIAQKVGRFELANKGTLFLDEVGDIPPELQPKLLRVLQEQEFERLGSNRTIKVDVRLVAATNRDLGAMVAARQFRSDLFYRLNVIPLTLPPLRERPEDIPALVRYFAQQHSLRLNKPVRSIPADTMTALTRYPWPGNVRELENFIERAVLLSPSPDLHISPSDLKTPDGTSADAAVTLAEAEREHILAILRQTNWVIGGTHGAAARLGMKRTTLQSKMRKLGIERPA
jgi:formate hydrogenlyase transcriptional activator